MERRRARVPDQAEALLGGEWSRGGRRLNRQQQHSRVGGGTGLVWTSSGWWGRVDRLDWFALTRPDGCHRGGRGGRGYVEQQRRRGSAAVTRPSGSRWRDMAVAGARAARRGRLGWCRQRSSTSRPGGEGAVGTPGAAWTAAVIVLLTFSRVSRSRNVRVGMRLCCFGWHFVRTDVLSLVVFLRVLWC